jgi:ribonucleoside-diphosphate reductase beta chain
MGYIGILRYLKTKIIIGIKQRCVRIGVVKLCEEAFESEKAVVEWMFEKGELEFLPKAVVIEFIKQRFNNSLQSIGIRRIFETDPELLKESEWFYDEVIATKHGDFFNKKSINYNKKSKSITSDDLF